MPLVSVLVISYNSQSFVVETLESIKSQSYNNIELIISDDCSSDNTVDLILSWLDQNSSRFVSHKLIKSKQNTGIPSNCNRGILASSGKYLKIIAADDLLLKSCIEVNVTSIIRNKARVLHSNTLQFNEFSIFYTKPNSIFYSIFNNPKINSTQQFNYLKFKWPINASTLFFEKNVFEEVGMFEEIFSIEDWPFLLKLTLCGIKVHHINYYTTKYRVHNMSITRNDSSNKLVNSFYLHQKDVVDKQLKSFLTWHELIYFKYKFLRFYFINKKTSNNSNNIFLHLINILIKIPDKTYEFIRISLIFIDLKIKPHRIK